MDFTFDREFCPERLALGQRLGDAVNRVYELRAELESGKAAKRPAEKLDRLRAALQEARERETAAERAHRDHLAEHGCAEPLLRKPLDQQPRRGATPARSDPLATTTGRPTATILIIDDDTEFVSRLSALLTAAGYKTLAADGVESAARILDRDNPRVDVVVVDLVLPGIASGFDIISVLTKRSRHYKIVACSGVYRQPLLGRVAEAIGADAFVEKPIPDDATSTWLTAIRRVLATGAAESRTDTYRRSPRKRG